MEQSLRFYETGLGFEGAFTLEKSETGEPWIIYLHVGEKQFVELFYGATEYSIYKDSKVGFSHKEKTNDAIINL